MIPAWVSCVTYLQIGSVAVDPHGSRPQLPLFEREACILSDDDAVPTEDGAASDDASDDAIAADDVMDLKYVSVRLLPVALNTDRTTLDSVISLVGDLNAATGAANAFSASVACVWARTRGARFAAVGRAALWDLAGAPRG